MKFQRPLLRWIITGLATLTILSLTISPVSARFSIKQALLSVLATPVVIDFPESTEIPEAIGFPPLYQLPLALSLHDHFFFLRPIEQDEVKWPTSDFRYGYFASEDGHLHTGIDLVAPIGQPVLAVGDGKVVFSGYGLINGVGNKDDPYGIAVVIRHAYSFEGKTIYSVYGHFSKALVEAGQEVRAGDPIGEVGITGNTTGPHLHFEIRALENGEQKVQNPELWLAPPLDHGVLAGRIYSTTGILLNSKVLWLKSIDNGQSWTITTYSQTPIERQLNDEFFRENYVLSDLPAGEYEISISYNYKVYKTNIQIIPGAVNFVTFKGTKGFTIGYPKYNDSALMQ